MAQKIGKLIAIEVARMKTPGLYSDGGNLWLQVGPTGAKSWVFRYSLHHRARWMGLGPFTTVSLSEAREIAGDKRLMLLKGKDPIAEQRREAALTRLAAASDVTFEQAASQYIEAHKGGWGHGYVEEWNCTLKKYAYPIIGKLSVADIDTALVLKVLEPIWSVIPVSAIRTRGRIESVLDWAKARELRAGENPARWRGHLQNLLAKQSRARKVMHFPALPYVELGDFMVKLRSREHYAVSPLELMILTATRSKETMDAKWDEVDLEKKVWTIPAERMKSGRQHRVPLSTQAVAVLQRMHQLRMSAGFVFPGFRHEKPLSKQAMGLYLRELGYTDFVPHGFRSTFRDWAADCTNFAREVVEFALAHKIGDMTENSYFRSDLFSKRGALMQAWADYCDLPSADRANNVVPISAAL